MTRKKSSIQNTVAESVGRDLVIVQGSNIIRGPIAKATIQEEGETFRLCFHLRWSATRHEDSETWCKLWDKRQSRKESFGIVDASVRRRNGKVIITTKQNILTAEILPRRDRLTHQSSWKSWLTAGKTFVHGLIYGQPLCGFSQKTPSKWPMGHTCVGPDAPEKITCSRCKKELPFPS